MGFHFMNMFIRFFDEEEDRDYVHILLLIGFSILIFSLK